MNQTITYKSEDLISPNDTLHNNVHNTIKISDKKSQTVKNLTGNDLWNLVLQKKESDEIIKAFYNDRVKLKSTNRDKMKAYVGYIKQGKFSQKASITDVQILFRLLGIQTIETNSITDKDDNSINTEEEKGEQDKSRFNNDHKTPPKDPMDSKSKYSGGKDDSFKYLTREAVYIIILVYILFIVFFGLYLFVMPNFLQNNFNLVINLSTDGFNFNNFTLYAISTVYFTVFILIIRQPIKALRRIFTGADFVNPESIVKKKDHKKKKKIHHISKIMPFKKNTR